MVIFPANRLGERDRTFYVQCLDTGAIHPLGPAGGTFSVDISGLDEGAHLKTVTMCGQYIALLQTELPDDSLRDTPHCAQVIVMDWRTGRQLLSRVSLIFDSIFITLIL